MQAIPISKDFKRGATRAILSIIFFIIVYIALIIGAVALTVACGYAGIMLIIAKPAFFTLMLGAGLMGMGVLIIIFLVKFIFTKHSADNSQLIEIKKEEEPELFLLIDDIVKAVNIDFPKKVFISSQVNASVFYDSGFWSMFLPVKKNLHIGLGLMNAVTVNEFKGILAHEFGHFSQRSMKVGSYVYNVNFMLHNMLYDNTGYENIVGRWANISGYFSIFVAGGIKMISGIQWVLGKVYNVVNINYMALSREMEFHADEVAAHVAGPQSLATSLVRLELANQSLTSVLNFYGEKIPENLKPVDIFEHHHYVMTFSANEFGLNFENGLPQVTLATKSRFNKSKLTFDDQWATHPSDDDRIKRLESLNIVVQNTDTRPAMSLFADKESIRAKVTDHLFSNIEYTGATISHALHDFTLEFEKILSKNTFPKKYNNFYDELPLAEFKNDVIKPVENTEADEAQLFGQDSQSLVYDIVSLENDLHTIDRLVTGEIKVKSFNYNEHRYNYKEASQLIPELKTTLQIKKAELADLNNIIYNYYYRLALNTGNDALYFQKLEAYQKYNAAMNSKTEMLSDMYALTNFVNQANSYETIEEKIRVLTIKEADFKTMVKDLLIQPEYQTVSTAELNDSFNNYIDNNTPYFERPSYNDEALKLLFTCLHNYNVVNLNVLFYLKKEFLDFQSSLILDKSSQ